MNFKVAALIGCTLLNFSFGLLVYLKNRKSLINLSYAIFMFFVALWSFGLAMFYLISTEPNSVFWSNFVYFMGNSIAVAFFYSSLVFPTGKPLPRRKTILPAGFLVLLFFLYFFTNSMVRGIEYPNGVKTFVYGNLHFLFDIHFTLLFVLAFWKLYQDTRHLTGQKREQAKYLLLSTFIGVAFNGATNVTMPSIFHNCSLVWTGPYITVVMLSIMTYAIVKYRMMGLKVAVKTITVPILSLSILASIIVWSFRLFPVLLNQNIIVIALGFTFGGVLVYYLLCNQTNFIVNKLFPPRDYSTLLDAYKDKVGKLYSVVEVSDFIINTIQETKEVESASLILQDKIKEKYLSHSSFGLTNLKNEDLQLTKNSALVNFLNRRNRRLKLDVLIKDELPKIVLGLECSSIIQDMDKLKAQVVIPLIDKEELIGVLCVGSKLTGDAYDSEDYVFFKELAERATINIVDAQLREEAEVTRAEQEHKARLSSMGEMTAAMAHEIDNPNYIIIGQAGAIKSKLDKYFPNDEKTAEIKAKCDWITETTLRLSAMIKRITDFAKPPKRGEYTVISPKKMIEKYIKLVEFQLKYNNTELKAHIPNNLPKIKVNVSELEHVFVNLVNNGIDAMEGSKDKRITFTASQAKDYVQIRVTDKGIGISQERLKAIFLPFVTEKDLIRKSKGTGLGLSIAYTIIERQKGRIWAESEGKDKGATFVIELPIYKEKEQNEDWPKRRQTK